MGVGPLPLSALRAFDAVARLGSFRRAAAELEIGHASVVRHIRNLQDWSSRQLVATSTKGVELTDDGQALHRSTAAAMGQIREAAEAFGPDPSIRVLRLWCASGLAARWLVPKVPELEALLPGHQILIRPTEALPDFSRGEADALIRYGRVDLDGAETTELDCPRMYPVASPEFLERHGPIGSVADLVRAPLIHEASTVQWREWLALAGCPVAASLPGLQLWQADLALDAAERGQGVALANARLLRKGHREMLVELLSTDIRLQPYVLVVPHRLRKSRAVSTLRDWLGGVLRQADSFP